MPANLEVSLPSKSTMASAGASPAFFPGVTTGGAGRFVGEPALLRFYILHCVFIPLVVGVLIAVHFWRVRKDGGISGPL